MTDEHDPPSIDRAELLERVDGDFQLLRELIELFNESSADLLSKLHDAAVRDDGRALAENAHALKGSVANFAAKDAYAVAWRLESMGRSGDLSRARETCRAMEEEIRRLGVALSRLAQEDRAR
ncbi:MAG TPA: Hpt domain-containing protein [Candidatus Bathyarchaeia archaeon]|nr:Hpt domain-containing protein [Candidatus Bathyarchaeia archaeon]